jgi:outer membrane receptor protein involved in Fe transport
MALLSGPVVLDSPRALAEATNTDDRDGPVRLEEVVVTATKRPETLQDVPVAVTAITSEDIAARGFTNYADYVNTVPNMWMQDIGPGQTQIYIRGLVASGGSGFPVATYFGEAVTSLLTNDGGFANLRLVDIDRVEVLRGPQGTLFGANSLAGVLRVVPKAPNLNDFQADVDARGWATAHSGEGSDHFEGVINVPILTDQLAARVVAYQDHIAGYLDNIVPAAAPIDYSASVGDAPAGTLVIPGHNAFSRKDINSEDIWGARGAVTWQPIDSLHVDLSYAAQEARLNSEAGAQPAFGDYVVQRPLDLYSRGEDLEEERIGQIVIGYDWSAATLTSATSYSRLERYAAADFGWLGVNAGFGQQLWPLLDRSKGSDVTQEIRLQSRGSAPFQWIAGYFYTNSIFDLGQTVPDYSCPACLPEVLYGQSFALETLGTQIAEKQKQQSVFGEVSYSFTPQWTVGVGARYLRDYVESFGTAGTGVLAGGNQPAAPPVGGRNSIFNPSGYIRFRANDAMTWYLQAARGFRSGTPNQALAYDPNGPCGATAAADGVGPLTHPDTLWTYELGLKSSWADGRIAANVAVFHQRWDGVQLNANQPCGFTGFVNGGNASGNGAELEMTARLGRSWSANLTASYVYNEFNSTSPGTGYFPGERVPGAPEENASAGLQYNFSPGPGWTGYARADYVYVGDVHYIFGAGATATPYLQGGYGQADARVALQRRQWDFELFTRNLTDKRAAEATGDPNQGGYIYMLRPREIGVEVRYSLDRTR